GSVGTFQPAAATITADNAFFQNLGSNGRTCFTCHQPQTGWTVSADSVRARFHASAGKDPIFRLVDGATCPTDDVSTPAAKRRAHQLLLHKGLIRPRPPRRPSSPGHTTPTTPPPPPRPGSPARPPASCRCTGARCRRPISGS